LDLVGPSFNGTASPSSLTLEEAVPLGYVLVDRLAKRHDVRCLAIKGPVLAAHGLREPRRSRDIDVLVDPAGLSHFTEVLSRYGWETLPQAQGPRLLQHHARVVRHNRWPCEIDAHWWFPGLFADPRAAFQLLWERRQVVPLAQQVIEAPDRASSTLIFALHMLRDPHRQAARIKDLVQRLERWTLNDREEVWDLAVRLDATESLQPLAERLRTGRPRTPGADTRSSSQQKAWSARILQDQSRALPWLLELLRPSSMSRSTVLRLLIQRLRRELAASRGAGIGGAGTLVADGLRDVARGGLILIARWRRRFK
jgi:hypothetical protein